MKKRTATTGTSRRIVCLEGRRTFAFLNSRGRAAKLCGICGMVNIRERREIGERQLSDMTQTLLHRAPDNDEHFLNERVGFGVRRLMTFGLFLRLFEVPHLWRSASGARRSFISAFLATLALLSPAPF